MTSATLIALFSFVLAPAAGAQSHASTDARLARVADSLYAIAEYAAAAEAYERLVHCDSGDAPTLARLGQASAMIGRHERAAWAFERASAVRPTSNVMYGAAVAHARLGHADDALAWLARAAGAGLASVRTLGGDAAFAALRDDPRYAAAVAVVERNFAPCDTDPRSRRFDFWIGEWDVRTAQGRPAGRNSIERVSGGCALMESWTDAQGGTGRSLNAFNRAEGMWQQFWVGQYGEVTEYRESEWVDGALRYVARGRTPAGAPLLRRMTFTPVSADLVRQFGEQSTDGGARWTTTFDLYYHRQP